MDIKKTALRCEWLLALLLVVPAVASADNNGVRYYVSLGTSLSVGVQPDASGANQLTPLRCRGRHRPAESAEGAP